MRRRWHALTSVATATHHLFELVAGTGLVFQPYLGLRGATTLWSVALPGWFLAAARGSPKWDRPLAFLAGLSIGGACVHFTLWPFETRRGVPLLVEAEGLRPDQLPAYIAVLYIWAGGWSGRRPSASPRSGRPPAGPAPRLQRGAQYVGSW